MLVRRLRRVAALFIGALAAAGLAAGPAAAQGLDWRAGTARIRITPDKPMRLAGYATRTAPFEGVDMDLHAKALALEDSTGKRALLITADLLGLPAPLCDAAAARIRKATGLERSQILFNASHTHYAPVVVADLEPSLSAPDAQLIRGYRQRLEESLATIGAQAVEDLKPARLAWGMGIAPFVTNRREITSRGIVLGVNPRGPADRGVPVLRVEDASGKARAIVFGAAAHCVTLTGNYLRVNGDYAGYAQLEVERAFPGAQAMFVTGCAGDASPFPRGSIEVSQIHGRNLGGEVLRVLGEKPAPLQGPLQTELRRVDLPLQQPSRAEVAAMKGEQSRWKRYFIDRALAAFEKGEALPRHYTAPFALWRFGSGLTLVAFSGETVVDYVAMTEKLVGPLNLWVAGYSNDLYGYLPSRRVLEEGGYETRGLYVSFGLFAPETEETVMAAIGDMAGATAPRQARKGKQ